MGKVKYSLSPEKGYSKNQFIAPKLLKCTKQGYASHTDVIESNDINKRAPIDDIGNMTLTAQGGWHDFS